MADANEAVAVGRLEVGLYALGIAVFHIVRGLRAERKRDNTEESNKHVSAWKEAVKGGDSPLDAEKRGANQDGATRLRINESPEDDWYHDSVEACEKN